MTKTELESYVGSLCNDPNHDRYTTTDIDQELENVQNQWNVEAKIIKDTITITVVADTRQYALSDLTGTPIAFERTTHKGIPLQKRSKQYYDLYAAGIDPSAQTGTPEAYYIEANDPDLLYITVFPTPQANDAGAYLVTEYIKAHTALSSSSDVPFMSGTTSNYLLRPYDYGLAFDAAARLLARDPSQENVAKMTSYISVAKGVLANVVQVFKALEAQEPSRLQGGRYWGRV